VNQYIAALHTGIESLAGDEWRLAFHLNERYGDYFKKHSSSWHLWLAGRLRQQLKSAPSVEVSVDGAPPTKLQLAKRCGSR
jgi:hypothetical protein